MPLNGLIFNIQKFSLHDGPGIRTTVFFKGCPLSCPWCHNPESRATGSQLLSMPELCNGCASCAAACPRGAISIVDGRAATDGTLCAACGGCLVHCPGNGREICGREMTVKEVLGEILKDRVFYRQSGGGVTFSGGEAMAQIDFLLELLAACRTEGLHTAVDTAGCVPWKSFERILGLTDLFLYDLKLMDEAAHLRHAGVSNREILANLRRLSEATEDILIRIPVIPGVNEDEANWNRTIDFLRTIRFRRIHLLPYHLLGRGKVARLGEVYPMEGIEPPTGETMERLRARFAAAGLPTVIGG